MKFLSVLLGLLVFAVAVPAWSKQLISAIDANQMLAKGKIVLVDIRRPDEWKQSGVAVGAKLISMHQPGFLQKLERLTGSKKDRPIALICATGGRTQWLTTQLGKRGYTGLLDVSEGMFGSSAGPGWLARKLPTISYP